MCLMWPDIKIEGNSWCQGKQIKHPSSHPQWLPGRTAGQQLNGCRITSLGWERPCPLWSACPRYITSRYITCLVRSLFLFFSPCDPARTTVVVRWGGGALFYSVMGLLPTLCEGSAWRLHFSRFSRGGNRTSSFLPLRACLLITGSLAHNGYWL